MAQPPIIHHLPVSLAGDSFLISGVKWRLQAGCGANCK